jgi:hypothetical protein
VLAEAKQAEARAVAQAAEEEELSENVVVRAFQRAAAAVSEASAEIKEQMISTAEVGGLEAEGITAGFAGFSKLLGAGIAVGFAANYIDGLAKMNVELDHLSVQSGIEHREPRRPAADRARDGRRVGADRHRPGEDEPGAGELQGAVEGTEGRASWNRPLGRGAAGPQAGRAAAETLRRHLLRLRTPAIALQQLVPCLGAAALRSSRTGGRRRNLSQNVKLTGEMTGVTEESATAARRWTEDTARLSAQFRSVMIPVMEHAEDVIRGIAATFEAASAVILTVFESIGTAVTAALFPLGKLGQLLSDLTTGQYQKLISDAKAAPEQFASIWKAGFDDIKGYWAEVKRTLTESTPVPKIEQAFEPGRRSRAKEKKGADKAFQRDEQQLAEIRLQAAKNGYVLGVDGEITFWNQRLAAAKKGSRNTSPSSESLRSSRKSASSRARSRRRLPGAGTDAVDSDARFHHQRYDAGGEGSAAPAGRSAARVDRRADPAGAGGLQRPGADAARSGIAGPDLHASAS